MIDWMASRIHAAWLDELYNWVTIEREDGNWFILNTCDEGFYKSFDSEDKAEAWVDRRCARSAAVFVLCFWRSL